MTDLATFAGNDPVLAELARVCQDLAARRRDLGFVRATEKRNWMSTFVREYQIPGANATSSGRIADAETASTTADRMETEGEVAALEVERDFLMAVLNAR